MVGIFLQERQNTCFGRLKEINTIKFLKREKEKTKQTTTKFSFIIYPGSKKMFKRMLDIFKSITPEKRRRLPENQNNSSRRRLCLQFNFKLEKS